MERISLRTKQSQAELKRTGYTDPAKLAIYRYLTQLSAILLVGIAVVVMLGWYLDIPRFRSFVLTFPSMRVTTALAFICSGIFVYLTQVRTNHRIIDSAIRIISYLMALLVFSVGMIRLYSFFSGITLDLDTIIFHLPPAEIRGGEPVVPNTSFFFITLGIAMLFFDLRIRKIYFSQVLVMICAVVTTPLIVSYLYQIELVQGVSVNAALPTLVSYLLLIVGLLFARPTRQLIDIFTKDSAGGYLMRRLIIYALVLPLLVGGLVLEGYRIHLYSSDFSYLLVVTSLILLFVVLIWENARSLHNSDIERRETREELFESEKKFSALAESDILGVVIANTNGDILEVNEGFSKLVGYTGQQLVDQVKWEQITPQNDQNLRTLLRRGRVQPFETELMKKDGTVIPAIIGVNLLNKAQGIFIAFALDITERKRLEERKDEFISIASHELKTPLTSIKGYTQLLQRMVDEAGDRTASSLLSKTNAHIDRLNGLIADLLDVSKIQSGKLLFNIDEFDAYDLVKDCVEGIQSTTATHKIVMQHPVHQKMTGDKYRLEQVFHNLLTNAIKYSPKSNKVVVKMAKNRRTVTISVQDFGIGIAQKHLNKLFRRFYRVESVSSRFSGLGIGLYISSEIVKRHGGRISVESTEGKGSAFFVELPIKNSAGHK